MDILGSSDYKNTNDVAQDIFMNNSHLSESDDIEVNSLDSVIKKTLDIFPWDNNPLNTHSPIKSVNETDAPSTYKFYSDSPQALMIVDHISESSVLNDTSEKGRFGNITYDLHDKHQEYLSRKEQIMRLNASQKIAFQLLSLLKQDSVSIKSYTKYADFVEKCIDFGRSDPDTVIRLPTRDRLIKLAAQRYNLDGLKPRVNSVYLKHAGAAVNIVTTDFEAVLTAQLTHPILSREGNWNMYDDENPFIVPPRWEDVDKSKMRLNNITSGKWFHDTWHMCCTTPNRDVLFPYMLFTDKTFIDTNGRLNQEPVMGTPPLKSEFMNKSDAAYTLGLIPDIPVLKKSLEPWQKMEDYHIMLYHVLDGLRKHQNNNKGFFWKFCHGGKLHDVVFKVQVMAVCGDHEGHDKQCGRKGGRGTLSLVCPKCKQPLESSDTVRKEAFPKISRKDIDDLLNKGDSDSVSKNYAHYPIPNGYNGIHMGCHGIGNINQCVMVDIMHTFRQGNFKYAKGSFFEAKRLNMKTKLLELKKSIKSTKSDDNDFVSKIYNENINAYEPVVTERLTEAELQSLNIFTKTFNPIIEELANKWGVWLQHQSDRSLGRTVFVNGITCNTKFQAQEQQGTLIILILVLCSSFGWQTLASYSSNINKKATLSEGGQEGYMGDLRVADYVWLFQELLLLDEIMRSDEKHLPWLTVHWVENDFRKYIEMMMDRFNRVTPRDKGMENKRVKFHSMVHIPSQWVMSGSISRTDSEDGERKHQDRSKVTARATQKIQKKLDEQGATRDWEFRCISMAVHELSTEHQLTNETKETLVQTEKAEFKGAGFIIENIEDCPQWKYIGRRRDDDGGNCEYRWHDMSLQGAVLDFLMEKVVRIIGGVGHEIKTYKSVSINGSIYQADPIFYTTKGTGEGWHDWAKVRLKGPAYHGIPGENAAHIMSFVSITGGNKSVNTCYNNSRIEYSPNNSMYMICHLLREHPNKKGSCFDSPLEQTRLVDSAYKEVHEAHHKGKGKKSELKLNLVPICAVLGVMIGVPDLRLILPDDLRLIRHQKKRREWDKHLVISKNQDHHHLFIQGKKYWPAIFKHGTVRTDYKYTWKIWRNPWKTPEGDTLTQSSYDVVKD
jgi:hypothetical protein